jgi:hypothetical protein
MPIPTLSVHPADVSPDQSPLRPFSRSAMSGDNEHGINIPSTSTIPISTPSMVRSLDRDSNIVYSRPSSDGTWATRFDVVVSPTSSSSSSSLLLSSYTENHTCYNRTSTVTSTATKVDGESCDTDVHHVQRNIPLATPVATHVTNTTSTMTPRGMMTTNTMVRQQQQQQSFPRDSSSSDGETHDHLLPSEEEEEEQHSYADLLALRQQLNEAEAALIENVSQWQFHWHEMAEVERLRRLVRESEQRMALNKSSTSALPTTTTTTTTTTRKSLSRNNNDSCNATSGIATTCRRSSSYGQAHMPIVSLPLNFTSGFKRSIDRAFSNPRRSLEVNTAATTTTTITCHSLSRADSDDHHDRYPVDDQSGGGLDIANSSDQSVPNSRAL